MRLDSKTKVVNKVNIEIEFDPLPRIYPIPQKLAEAFLENKKAKEAFEKIPPSRQKEIIRYLGSLKSEEAIKRNTEKVIKLLITN